MVIPLIWGRYTLRSRTLDWMLLAGIIAHGTGLAFGQTYPDKPVRIVTAEVGGAQDVVSRIVSQGITGILGQQVVVDNRGTLIAIESVSHARPDGYTLLVTGTTLWLWPLLQNVSFDALHDFSPISLLVREPSILVVHPSLPVHDVADLIALAKVRPGELNCATATTGGAPHIAAELFKFMAGVNIASIPYKGGGKALIDLFAGQVQLMFPLAGGAAPYVASHKLKALAVTSAEPIAMFRGVPTIAASGLPGYESESSVAVFAPAGTPASIIKRLNQDIVQFMTRGNTRERFFNMGSEPVGSSPDQLAARMKSEIASLGEVFKHAKINVRQ